MPKVHRVERARKTIPSIGVQPGDSYYWWRTRAPGARSGVTRVSKTYPRPSQLTQSDYWQAVYSLQESVVAPDGGFTSSEDLESAREDWASQARQIGEEQQEKLDNMPEGLQGGPTGELLRERAEACEAWAEALEQVEVLDREDCDSDEEFLEALEEALGEMSQAGPEGG